MALFGGDVMGNSSGGNGNAVFDPNKNLTLEDVLGNQAGYQKDQINDAAVQKKRRLVSSEAASGRLGSGVSNYPLADLASGNATDVSGVDTGLAEALGQIPAESYLNDNQLARNYELARLIGSLNKKNGTQSGLEGAAAGASAGSTFGPWGAVAGGIGGGLFGAFG